MLCTRIYQPSIIGKTKYCGFRKRNRLKEENETA